MSDDPSSDLQAAIDRTKAALKRSREASRKARELAEKKTQAKPIKK